MESAWGSSGNVAIPFWQGNHTDYHLWDRSRAQPWPDILNLKPESWLWEANNVMLRWSEEESAYGLPIRWFKVWLLSNRVFSAVTAFQCVVMPKNRTGKPLHIASLKPPAYTLSTTNSLNRVAMLEVTPAGMSKMDDVVTSALYVHRMFVRLNHSYNFPAHRWFIIQGASVGEAQKVSAATSR